MSEHNSSVNHPTPEEVITAKLTGDAQKNALDFDDFVKAIGTGISRLLAGKEKGR